MKTWVTAGRWIPKPFMTHCCEPGCPKIHEPHTSRRRESANIGHRRHPEETEEAAACGAQRTLGPEPAPAPGSGHQRVQGRGTRPSTPRAWHGAGFWKYGCLAGICFLGFLLKYKTCCSQGPQCVFYKCSYALSTFERCARGGSFIATRRWLSRGQLRSGADENSASVQNMHLGLVRFK